jgi:glycosyltransferase involved in cell wall biosynthesis
MSDALCCCGGARRRARLMPGTSPTRGVPGILSNHRTEGVVQPSLKALVRWLEEFEQDHGRPLRVLHFGNIANNAYLNAKFLRTVGVDAHVLSSDYHHIMATPEWEEIEITQPYGDDNNPDFSVLDLKGYRRPEWFVSGTISECVQKIASNAMHDLLLPGSEASPVTATSSPGEKGPIDRSTKELAPLGGKPDEFAQRTQEAIAGPAARLQGPVAEVPTRLEGEVPEVMTRLPAMTGAAQSIFEQLDRFAARSHTGRRQRRFRMRPFYWAAIDSAAPLGRRIPGLQRLYRFLRYNDPLIGERRGCPGPVNLRAVPRPAEMIAPAQTMAAADQAVLSIDCASISPPGEILSNEDAAEIERLPVGLRTGEPDPVARAIDDFAAAFPNRPDQLKREDLLPFVTAAPLYREAFQHYDLVQCYATHPLWGYLAGNRPYVAFEHGTLRTFTMGDDPISRLTAIGYRRAAHSFITNGDCLEYARALEIAKFSPMIHPIDVELHRRDLEEPRAVTRRRFEADVLLFCPLRHDWDIKGTDVHVRALPLIRRCVPGRIVLLLVDWGRQVEESRALLADSGCADCAVWLPPVSRITMTRLIRAADVVLDQIALPHFGATAPQALAAGTPVISSYEPESTAWIVGEPAPILPAFDPAEVCGAVVQALDQAWRGEFTKRARHWVDTYHHPDRVVVEHLRVYREILEGG